MKKILIAFLFLPLLCHAQVDSSTIKITVSAQARDIEFFTGYTFGNPAYELLFDATKTKFRVANPPTNTTIVQIDTIEAGTWLSLLNDLRQDPIAIQAGIINRIEAAVRAAGNTWVNNTLITGNAAQIAQAIGRRLEGRKRLRRN